MGGGEIVLLLHLLLMLQKTEANVNALIFVLIKKLASHPPRILFFGNYKDPKRLLMVKKAALIH